MNEAKRSNINWRDNLWLIFSCRTGPATARQGDPQTAHPARLCCYSVGAKDGSSRTCLKRGPAYLVLLKIVLATPSIDHTGELSINSSYYPIYFLPIITAAEYFGLGVMLLYIAGFVCRLFVSLPGAEPQEYEITIESYSELAIRILFFFLASMVVMLRSRDPSPGPSAIRIGPDSGRDARRFGAGAGRGTAFRTSGCAGPDVGRTCARNSQSRWGWSKARRKC